MKEEAKEAAASGGRGEASRAGGGHGDGGGGSAGRSGAEAEAAEGGAEGRRPHRDRVRAAASHKVNLHGASFSVPNKAAARVART